MGSSKGKWSREELEDAWRRYQASVVDVGKTWDWSSYADHFTEDAKLRRARAGQHGGPRKHPRVDRLHDEHLPRQRDADLPGRLVLDRCRQGLGHLQEHQHHEGLGATAVSTGAGVITVLEYAGDDKWSYEEDAYNPMNFMLMIQQYIQRSHELGTISDDAREFAKNMNWELT